MLACFACQTYPENNLPPITETTESENEQPLYVQSLEVNEIGVPYEKLSPKARVPWDLCLYQDYLYVGAGDYDANLSPKVFQRYHTENGVWESCGRAYDEEIHRFIEIGDQLCVPGADPLGDWSKGNYYILQQDAFSLYRVIPNAIHTFDIVEYDGKLFVGNGVSAGKYPVEVSEVGSDSFTQVIFYKNDHALDTRAFTEIRVYDFFVCNDTLYAFLTLDAERSVYRYENGVFVYDNLWTYKLVWVRDEIHVPIWAKVSHNNTVYLTTGLLYATNDLNTFTAIDVGNTQRITDILVYDDVVYALGYCKLDTGIYENRIFRLSEQQAVLVASFQNQAPAISFARDESTWYFGLSAPAAGCIISASIE